MEWSCFSSFDFEIINHGVIYAYNFSTLTIHVSRMLGLSSVLSFQFFKKTFIYLCCSGRVAISSMSVSFELKNKQNRYDF